MEEFTVLVSGLFTEERLKVDYRPGTALKWDSRAQIFIEKVWKKYCRVSLEAGVTLYNGNVFHLEDFSARDGFLCLTVSDIDFRSCIGTGTGSFGNEFPGVLRANPLSVSVVLVTEDEKIVMEKRKRVDYRRRAYHVVAGFVEAAKDTLCDVPNPFHTMRREVREELALVLDTPLYATGLVATGTGTELCFYSRLAISFADLFDVKTLGPTDGEIDALETTDNTPEAVTSFLASHPHDVVPSGRACLMLYGRHVFGEKWYNRNHLQ